MKILDLIKNLMTKTKKTSNVSTDSNESVPIVMRVSDDTLSKIDDLQHWLAVDNKTNVIAMSIRLALNICKHM